MIKPDSYVKQLLYDHDCVVIPDFGGFILRESPAQYQPLTHQVKPYTRSVFFNSGLSGDDGLLAKSIAENLDKSFAEAHELLNQWVSYANTEISLNNRLKFGQIGTFFVNAEGKKWFAPNHKLNFSKETFGLEPVTLSPLKKEVVPEIPVVSPVKSKPEFKEPDKVIPLKRTKSRVWLKVAAVVLIGGCIGIAGYYVQNDDFSFINSGQNASFTTLPDSGNETVAAAAEDEEVNFVHPETEIIVEDALIEESLQDFSQPYYLAVNPDPVIKHENVTVVNIAEEKPDYSQKYYLNRDNKQIDVPAETKKEVKIENAVTDYTQPHYLKQESKPIVESVDAATTNNEVIEKTYTILAGAFIYESNAQRQADKLKSFGFETTILKPEHSRLTRVHVGHFTKRESAEKTLLQLNKHLSEAYILEK